MNQTVKGSTATSKKRTEAESFIKGLRGVRYQVKDVARSVDFYTRQLGFKLSTWNICPPSPKSRSGILN